VTVLDFLRAQWDRAVAVALAIGGVVALLLGYLGVAGTGLVAGQLPYVISGGLFGIMLMTAAATLWLSADLRDEWRELRALRQAIGASSMPDDGAGARARPPGAGPNSSAD